MKFNVINFSVFLILISPTILSCNEKDEIQADFKWEITFEDNFNFFDTTKWATIHKWGHQTSWSAKELQWYKNENVKVENGILKLTALRESLYGRDNYSENHFNFTSGMIRNKSFTQTYGKWEMRVRFPFRKGFWTAFWLLPEQIPTLPEIDVFEYFGINENQIHVAHHWGIDYPNWGGSYFGKTEPFYYVKSKAIDGNFSNVWMVWSFECYPNRMVWKLNDRIVYESTEGIPTAPLYMIANIAIKDFEQNNFEVDQSNNPYVMEIDYVKIYKMVPSEN